MSCCNNSNDSLVNHLYRFIGETVTIFTTSGGPSGCGFTGVLLSVNNRFVRLLTQMGDAPSNPLSRHICNDMGSGCMPSFNSFSISNNDNLLSTNSSKTNGNKMGSVCDIPINRIAAFCHNTV